MSIVVTISSLVALSAMSSSMAHTPRFPWPPCPVNEEVPECEPCMQTCDDMRYKKWCVSRCTQAHPHCYCKYGFLRNEWGRCVPDTMCLPLNMVRKRRSTRGSFGTLPGSSRECPANQDSPKCVPCLRTCADVREAKVTGEICSWPCRPNALKECFCKPGFVFDFNGRCVALEKCMF